MRIVFFGTPAVAVPTLDALLSSSHDVVGAVSQPDRPRGRGRETQPTPVKQRALDAALPVLQPASPKDPGFVEALTALAPDLLAIVAYGHILPLTVLQIAPALNVHFSLLPRYRGAAPVQRALMDGATETGVSVFLLEPTVDTGPILGLERITLTGEETSGDVFDRLAPIGAGLLTRCVDDLAADRATPVVQDSAEASRAPKITPAEAVIDWTQPAERIVNVVRGLSPAPVAWCAIAGTRVSVFRARIAEGGGDPGSVLSTAPFIVAAGHGAVELVEIQAAGKRRMDAGDWVRGARIGAGDRFDLADAPRG